MNTGKIIARLLLAWIALSAAQVVSGMLIHVNTPPMPNVLPWLMLSNAFVVLAVGAAAMRSEWKGWKLGLALFAIPAAIATVNSVEGVLFLTNAKIDWRGVVEITLVGYALAAAVWALIFSSKTPVRNAEEWPIPERSLIQKVWRFAFCSAAYVFLYFLAGLIIIPYVRDFYATQHIPSMGQIVLLQFFFRGPVFVLVCLLLLRMLRLPRLSGALAVGLAFTILSGVATLIVPNPFFPDSVRWFHFREVTSSNFVFGCVVGWVWSKTQMVTHRATALA
jgi:hypothetical protein